MTQPHAFVTRQIFPEALELIAREAGLEVWPEGVSPDAGPATPEK